MFLQPSLLYTARTTVTMSTQEVPVETPFPDMNIDKQHGPVHVHSATATITRIAKSPPSKGFTTKVIMVVMKCTGNLDTDTVLIENPDILRMFVEKEGKIVISFTQLPMMIPIWKLEPAGPMPDNPWSRGHRRGPPDDKECLENLSTCMGAPCGT